MNGPETCPVPISAVIGSASIILTLTLTLIADGLAMAGGWMMGGSLLRGSGFLFLFAIIPLATASFATRYALARWRKNDKKAALRGHLIQLTCLGAVVALHGWIGLTR